MFTFATCSWFVFIAVSPSECCVRVNGNVQPNLKNAAHVFNCTVTAQCGHLATVNFIEILRTQATTTEVLAQLTDRKATRTHPTACPIVAVKNVSQAIDFCELMGGYLAEIEDSDEYQIVTGEFSRSTADVMLLGGTDAEKEGTWLYQHSRVPVKFFHWLHGQPDNAGNNEACIEVRKIFHLKMNDVVCSNSQHGDSNFLCEIPRNLN
ncbi:hypothetical protein Btru_071898 [Bulinus truncatus]|nr:hypothetical protein Btru_071898 [Bulinus truncatus]